MSFKEKWQSVDETCPSCGQVTKINRGITKQNLKRLITPKFNSTEILITIMLIMIIILSYSYKAETKTCREWLKPLENIKDYDSCVKIFSQKCELGLPQVFQANGTNEEINATLLQNLVVKNT